MSKYRRRRQKLSAHTSGNDRHHKLAAHTQKALRLQVERNAALGEGRKRERARREVEDGEQDRPSHRLTFRDTVAA